jgi:hypothetical protein
MSRRLPNHHHSVADAATGRADGISLRQIARRHAHLADMYLVMQFGQLLDALGEVGLFRQR